MTVHPTTPFTLLAEKMGASKGIVSDAHTMPLQKPGHPPASGAVQMANRKKAQAGQASKKSVAHPTNPDVKR